MADIYGATRAAVTSAVVDSLQRSLLSNIQTGDGRTRFLTTVAQAVKHEGCELQDVEVSNSRVVVSIRRKDGTLHSTVLTVADILEDLPALRKTIGTMAPMNGARGGTQRD